LSDIAAHSVLSSRCISSRYISSVKNCRLGSTSIHIQYNTNTTRATRAILLWATPVGLRPTGLCPVLLGFHMVFSARSLKNYKTPKVKTWHAGAVQYDLRWYQYVLYWFSSDFRTMHLNFLKTNCRKYRNRLAALIFVKRYGLAGDNSADDPVAILRTDTMHRGLGDAGVTRG